jgi:hypothetical protein
VLPLANNSQTKISGTQKMGHSRWGFSHSLSASLLLFDIFHSPLDFARLLLFPSSVASIPDIHKCPTLEIPERQTQSTKLSKRDKASLPLSGASETMTCTITSIEHHLWLRWGPNITHRELDETKQASINV